MITIRLDALGAVLSFAGGVVLAWDALQAPRRARRRLGATEVTAAAEGAGSRIFIDPSLEVPSGAQARWISGWLVYRIEPQLQDCFSFSRGF